MYKNMLVVLTKSTTKHKYTYGSILLKRFTRNYLLYSSLSSSSYFVKKNIQYSASYSTTTSNNKPDIKFPLSTKVVICGGGLFGTSVAYHLANLGFKDVILVTRDK
jgi:hypothetical protein